MTPPFQIACVLCATVWPRAGESPRYDTFRSIVDTRGVIKASHAVLASRRYVAVSLEKIQSRDLRDFLCVPRVRPYLCVCVYGTSFRYPANIRAPSSAKGILRFSRANPAHYHSRMNNPTQDNHPAATILYNNTTVAVRITSLRLCCCYITAAVASAADEKRYQTRFNNRKNNFKH